MKSAYELALERIESQGIERPREDSLSDDDRTRVAEVKRRAEAKLAELKIMHEERLAKILEADKRDEEIADFQRERQRIEEDREHKIGQIRGR